MTGNDHAACAGILGILKKFLEDRETRSIALTQDLLQAKNVAFSRMNETARSYFHCILT